MSDLKIIDELLIDFMHAVKLQPRDLETYNSATRDALCRLRDAWNSDEMWYITLTWNNYFKETS